MSLCRTCTQPCNHVPKVTVTKCDTYTKKEVVEEQGNVGNPMDTNMMGTQEGNNWVDGAWTGDMLSKTAEKQLHNTGGGSQ